MDRRQVVPLSLTAVAVGVIGVVILDPHSGRRRRALIRDKVQHRVTTLWRSIGANHGRVITAD